MRKSDEMIIGKMHPTLLKIRYIFCLESAISSNSDQTKSSWNSGKGLTEKLNNIYLI